MKDDELIKKHFAKISAVLFKNVSLHVAHDGYREGELTGDMDGCYRYAIRLRSGLIIYLYEHEFTHTP